MRAVRCRVYQPKSVDATETTVLTPRAGASHADAFQVASVTGLAGYQPYLHRVLGRAGAIDPLTKSVDVGALRLTMGDALASSTATNVQRWLTAFTGDSANRWALPACKVVVEESLDWDDVAKTGTWTAYFVGRTLRVTADGALRRGLEVRDLSTDLEQPVFTGAPHADVASYAKRARLWPIGMPMAWGGIAAQSPIPFTVVGTELRVNAGQAGIPRIVTREFLVRSSGWDITLTGVSYPPITLVVQPSSGVYNGQTLRYHVGWTAFTELNTEQRALSGVWAGSEFALAAGDTGVMWMEAADREAPTDALPLLIGDVHPVTLWRDLLAGKFGQLNSSTGAPDFPVAYDTAAFATLIADTTFPNVRFLITERAKSMRAFIEDEILAVFSLSYTVNASGQIVPVDLRRPTTAPASVAITDADLVAGPDAAAWEPDETAVSRLRGTYFVDAPATDVTVTAAGRDPDLPSTRLFTTEQPYTVLIPSARGLDLARKPHEITSRGLRMGPGESGGSRETTIQQQFDRLSAELDGPFGLGAMYAILRVGRSGVAAGLKPGDYVSPNCTGLENPATNERGGARLMRVVEVSDEGLGGVERRLRCLDLGVGAVVGPPSPPTAASTTSVTQTSGVVTYTMPATNLPAYLRLYVDTGTGYSVLGADVPVTAGASATQAVTYSPLASGTAYTTRAAGVGTTGVLSTTFSPTATVTTSAATVLPTPAITGSLSGSVFTLTITPGAGTPSGVEWVVFVDAVEFDRTLTTTYQNLAASGSHTYVVRGEKVGHTNSANSNTVTLP